MRNVAQSNKATGNIIGDDIVAVNNLISKGNFTIARDGFTNNFTVYDTLRAKCIFAQPPGQGIIIEDIEFNNGEMNGSISVIQHVPVSPAIPTAGQVLTLIAGVWTPATPMVSGNLVGDVTGPIGSNTISAIKGVTVGASAATPTVGQVLAYNGTEWIPDTPPLVGNLAGDVTGPVGSNTVVALQNVALSATTPLSGEILIYDGPVPGQWAPGPAGNAFDPANPVFYGTGTSTNNGGLDSVTIGAGASTIGTSSGTALGAAAIVGGNGGIAVGFDSATGTGSGNISIGPETGDSNYTGSNVTLIGSGLGITNPAASNTIVIGTAISATQSNEVIIGGSTMTGITLSANIPAIPVPNNYYASLIGVKVGGLYRSKFNSPATGSSFAIVASFLATGTVLTVTSTGGIIEVGMFLSGGTVAAGVFIEYQLSGTPGGVGTYAVNVSQNLGVTATSVLYSIAGPDIVYIRTQ